MDLEFTGLRAWYSKMSLFITIFLKEMIQLKQLFDSLDSFVTVTVYFHEIHIILLFKCIHKS